MAKIKIEDLPLEEELTPEELSEIVGGLSPQQHRKMSQRKRLQMQHAMNGSLQKMQIMSNILRQHRDRERALIQNTR